MPGERGERGQRGRQGNQGNPGEQGERGLSARGERRRFDPIHLLAYVLLAGMFTFSQVNVTQEAVKACESANSLREQVRFVMDELVPDRQLERVKTKAETFGLDLFAKEEC